MDFHSPDRLNYSFFLEIFVSGFQNPKHTHTLRYTTVKTKKYEFIC
jgi:hypothetical protein